MRVVGRCGAGNRALGLHVIHKALGVEQVGVHVGAGLVHGAQRGVAVLACGDEVVGDQHVGLGQIDRGPGAGRLVAHLHVAEALALGLAHVQVPAHASGVGVRAVGLGVVQVVGRGVFQGCHQLGTGQVHLDQHVGEGQDGVGRVHAHRACRHGNAHAACVLQGKVGTLAGGQEGFGHHLGGIAATGQGVGGFAAGHARAAVGGFAGHAHQAQGVRGGADGDGALRCHLARVAGQRLRGRGVRGGHAHLGAGGQLVHQGLAVGIGQGLPGACAVLALEVVANHQLGRAAALAHAAAVVKLHVHQAVGLGVFPGLANTDRAAVLVLHHGGVGPRRGGHAHGLEVAQQRVRVAANDHVHIAELGRDDLVGVVAQVRQQHDVANALGLEFVDGFLRGRGFVQELGGGQGARRIGDLGRRRQAHDAHVHTVHLLDQVGLHVRGAIGGGQCGASLRHYVGGQRGGFAGAAQGGVGQRIQKALERGVTVVELVVAQRHRIKADGVHHLRVGLALEEGVVLRAGDRIARVQLDQVGGVGQGLENGRLARKAAQFHLRGHAVQRQLLGRDGFELRVVVVDVGDVQLDRLEAGRTVAVAAAAGGEHQGGCAQGGPCRQAAGRREGVRGVHQVQKSQSHGIGAILRGRCDGSMTGLHTRRGCHTTVMPLREAPPQLALQAPARHPVCGGRALISKVDPAR